MRGQAPGLGFSAEVPMSELLWTCERGSVFSSEANGLSLEVTRAPSGGGFRYLLRRPAGAVNPYLPLASGYRDDLREAIAAAERTAKSFARREIQPAA
jgi:hypothetical protein